MDSGHVSQREKARDPNRITVTVRYEYAMEQIDVTLVAFPSSPDEPARCPLRGECEPTGAERRIDIEVRQLNIDGP